MIARVAVFLPVERAFDYAVPPPLSVQPGARVWVPYGARSVEGVVTALDPADAAPPPHKAIARLVDAPPIGADLVQLAAFIADYYLAPPGEVMRLCLPAGGRAKARRTLVLTDEGRRAAQSLSSALLSPSVQSLPPKAQAALAQLLPPGEAGLSLEALEQAIAGAGPTLRLLEAAGLVTRIDEVRTRAARMSSTVTLARQAAPNEPALKRSPKRAALYARIREAGTVELEELRAIDVRAREQVNALVEAGLVAEARHEARRDPFAQAYVERTPPPPLTAAQEAALAALEPALTSGTYSGFLLHGVTGSGKTEVYLRAIERTLALGRRALVLVPEISLTPQLAARFRGRFGDGVAVLHSALSEADRADAFRRIQRGEVAIALGARSAVFAPFDAASAPLGMLVVDEEHDPSFKQQEGVRYHGRDVALVRARSAGAVALLGSATPSLESWQAASDGRLRLLTLPDRATARPLPEVEVLDLKVHKTGEGGFFSARLHRALEETLAAGEQAILFLNRRGFSTFILCKACGQSVRCRDCSVTLTYHRREDRLLCHYCGYAIAPPRVCPQCSAKAIERLGYGTEQVEAAVHERFPQARVARLDRDTAEGGGLERVLDGVRTRAIDVVVGTQMVTKGHDFPDVTLVGVVLADHGMGLPDFRASERTFQLLEQVAGRAGRGERPGRVIIQTFQPQHPAIGCARDHDYHRFVRAELEARRELDYPPFARLACVHVDGADAGDVRRAAEAAAKVAREAAGRAPDELSAGVLGPSEAPLSRLKGRTRWQLFLRARTPRALRTLVRHAVTIETPRSVRLSVDVDPISML